MFNLMGSKSDDGMFVDNMHDLCYNPLRGQFILLLLLYFCCYSHLGGGVIPPDVCQQIIRESPTFFFTSGVTPLKLTL